MNRARERVGRELVWLAMHKDPDVFSRETVLSLSTDPVSQLWNHITGHFRAWERVLQPLHKAHKSNEQVARGVVSGVPGGVSADPNQPVSGF